MASLKRRPAVPVPDPTPTGKLPLTVAMVVHHEAAVIARALHSVADVASQIVVVHDGPCRDQTLTIARRLGAQVFTRPHQGAPEPHRPFSFRQAEQPWILQLDADEYLTTELRTALPRLLSQPVTGYKVAWLEELNGRRFFNLTKEALFRKELVSFIGVPCEYVKPLSSAAPLVTISAGLVNAPAVSNYQDWQSFTRKYRRFARVQATMYTRPFSEIQVWNYAGSDWEPKIRLRIQHPLLLGILGMWAKYVIVCLSWGVSQVLGRSPAVSLAAIPRLIWYNTIVFWGVFRRTGRW